MSATAAAQCPSWVPTLGGSPPPNGAVIDLATFDDGLGGGPALYVGGLFTSAGGVAGTSAIARWDGTSWSALAGGMSGSTPTEPTKVSHLLVFDDGTGPALYAAGSFTAAGGTPANNIAKWNPSTQTWSALGSGTNEVIYSLAAFSGGSGPELYVGGKFTTAGGATVNRIARWNGATWSSVGGGMNHWVVALTTFNDGAGLKLYAGGYFTKAGGKPANYVASWNGTAWSKLGAGTNDIVLTLTTFNDGAGNKLYAGGPFIKAGNIAGTNRVAAWNGSAWSKLGSGLNSTAWILEHFDDGSGPALYAGGSFTAAGGVPKTVHIARWNGASWSALQDGMLAGAPLTDAVHAMCTFDDGSGPSLHVGGIFQVAPAGDVNLAKWQGCP